MTGWDRDRVASLLASVEGYLQTRPTLSKAAAQATKEFIELKELTRSRISDLQSEIKGWRDRDQRTADYIPRGALGNTHLPNASIYLCTWEDWNDDGFIGTMEEIWENFPDLKNDKSEEDWHEIEFGNIYSTYSWDRECPEIGSVIINDNMRIKCIRRGDLCV